MFFSLFNVYQYFNFYYYFNVYYLFLGGFFLLLGSMSIKTINIPIFVFYNLYAKCLFTLLHSLFLNLCDIFQGLWLSSRGWPHLAELTWGRWDDHMNFLIQWWWLWASTLYMRHMRCMTTYSWEGHVTYPQVELMSKLSCPFCHAIILCDKPLYFFLQCHHPMSSTSFFLYCCTCHLHQIGHTI